MHRRMRCASWAALVLFWGGDHFWTQSATFEARELEVRSKVATLWIDAARGAIAKGRGLYARRALDRAAAMDADPEAMLDVASELRKLRRDAFRSDLAETVKIESATLLKAAQLLDPLLEKDVPVSARPRWSDHLHAALEADPRNSKRTNWLRKGVTSMLA